MVEASREVITEGVATQRTVSRSLVVLMQAGRDYMQ